MIKHLRAAATAFFLAWLFACAVDAVANLHWPNPGAWHPGMRAFALVEATAIALAAYCWSRAA